MTRDFPGVPAHERSGRAVLGSDGPQVLDRTHWRQQRYTEGQGSDCARRGPRRHSSPHGLRAGMSAPST